MKNLITFLISLHVILFTFHGANGQTGIGCLPEGITFTSQEQIDNFQTNYPGCTEIEGDVIIKGDDITNLSGLSILNSIMGDLRIGENWFHLPNLTQLTGLENITFIGGSCYVGYNSSLLSLSGLAGLEIIGDDLIVEKQELLTDLTGLDNLTSIGGNCIIAANSLMTGLTGLGELNSIGGNLWLAADYQACSEYYTEGNPQLQSLLALSGLNSIGGDLRIEKNYFLNNLEGLESISTFYNVLIADNTMLSSLAGLSGLTSIAGDLQIKDNPSLSTCEVQSICAYLAAPNGTVTIQNNAPGCNNPEEVEEACRVGVGQLDGWTVGQLPVIVYPNPFSEIVHLEYEIENPAPVCIQVYNAMGVMVADLSDGILAEGKHQIIWNAAHLPAGLYFCKVIAGKESTGLKLIRQ